MINFINNTVTDESLKQDLIKPWQDFNNELQSELQNYTNSLGDFDESKANQTYSIDEN